MNGSGINRGGQFAGLHLEGEILSGQPHLFSWLVLGSGNPVTIRQLLASPGRLGDGLSSRSPHLPALGDVFVDQRNGDLALLG